MAYERWQKAQELEAFEWRLPDIPLLEYQEVEKKYGRVFADIQSEIGLSAESRILDVGCGPTIPTRLFQVGQIYAFDPLAGIVEVVTASPRAYQLFAGMGESIPLPTESIDLAACRNVLDHTHSPRSVLREMHRVTKKNGWIVIALYTYSPFIAACKQIAEKLGPLRNVEHPFAWTPGQAARLISEWYDIAKCLMIHEGKHSTDYGKVAMLEEDSRPLHRLVIWLNLYVFGSGYFVRELLFLARSKPH